MTQIHFATDLRDLAAGTATDTTTNTAATELPALREHAMALEQGSSTPSEDQGGSDSHGGDGNDDLPGSGGDDTIAGGGGDDHESGGAGDDHLSGGEGHDILDGGDGNDRLDGGHGSDDLAGGSGDDTYVVDSSGDTVTEAASSGHDRVEASVSYHLGANVEDVVLTGTAAINAAGNDLDNHETGNAGHNELHGGRGNDALSGGGGADLLDGGTGNDTLSGGTGDDSMNGGSGDDVYVVDSVGDHVTEAAAGGTDRVDARVSYHLGANVENVSLKGTADIDATGNDLGNKETGNSGHNELHGGGGNDALSGAGGDDLLEGGTGNDTLSGGTGDDSLSGGSGADTFVLNSVTGSDAIGDFGSGLDRLLVSEGKFHFGDGDTVVEGGKVASGSGGYSSHAELVIISHDITGDITFASAAAAIGHASDSYAEGQHVLFAVDNGTKTAVYDFHSAGHDATVSAGELTLLATLDHTASTTLADYAFGH